VSVPASFDGGKSAQPAEPGGACAATSPQDPDSGEIRHRELSNSRDREQRERRRGQRAVRGINDAENQGDERVRVILLVIHSRRRYTTSSYLC
jgi:hypothetical protein